MAVRLRVDLNQVSQSVSNNTSKVRARVYAISDSGSFNGDPCSGSLTLNGTKYSFSHSFSANTTTLLYDTTRTISHNSDGTKTVSASARFVTGVSSGTITASDSLTLTKINRRSQIKSISSFNIESGTTVNITKYVSSYTDTLRIYKGSTLIKTVTNITNGSKVTFSVSELEKLFDLSKTSNSISLKFELTTYNDSSSVGSTSVETTGVIQNSNPQFITLTTKDDNSVTTALTGNDAKFIKRHSSLCVEVKASPQKGAGISHFLIDSTKFSATYDEAESCYKGKISVTNIADSYYNVYVVDTRGNSTLNTIRPDYIDYSNIEKGASSWERENQVGEKTTISLEGSFWNSSFSEDKKNNITASYKYKSTQSSSYITGTTPINLVIAGNQFKFSGAIKGDTNAGFDINDTYEVIVTVKDTLDSKEFKFTIECGIPGIAFYKNNIAVHGVYDESLGGQQIYGDLYLNKARIIEPNIITLKTDSTAQSMSTSDNYHKIDFPVVLSKVGTKLTITRRVVDTDLIYGVEIGKGVTKVKASATVQFNNNNNTSTMYFVAYIYKYHSSSSQTNIARAITPSVSASNSDTATIAPILIDVEDGDFLYINSYKSMSTGSGSIGQDNRTLFTVEVVEQGGIK